jgi:hypothetical protein
MEKIQSEKIVKEFLDPLSKKVVKREKKLKIYEKYSVTEKELFKEADRIIKKRNKKEELMEKKKQELLEKEKYPKNYIPKNNVIEELDSHYYDKTVSDCVELDNNEIRRIFNTYDKSSIGLVKKNEIQYIFLDIKNVLSKSIVINEKKFIDLMLDFYAKSKETCTVSDIKKCFNNILHDSKSNTNSKYKILPDLVYLGALAFKDSNFSPGKNTFTFSYKYFNKRQQK